jgi:hypothetical protein
MTQMFDTPATRMMTNTSSCRMRRPGRFSGPGFLLCVVETELPQTVLANCLTGPTAMTLDGQDHVLYVTDLAGHASSRFPCHGNRLAHAQPWPLRQFQYLLGRCLRRAPLSINADGISISAPTVGSCAVSHPLALPRKPRCVYGNIAE